MKMAPYLEFSRPTQKLTRRIFCFYNLESPGVGDLYIQIVLNTTRYKAGERVIKLKCILSNIYTHSLLLEVSGRATEHIGLIKYFFFYCIKLIN